MKVSEIEAVQRCYPQIYLACHVKHIRASSTVHRVSARDSSLLVHLSQTVPTTPTALAAHLGVQRSTLSAAIGRLAKLGYLRRESRTPDRRVAALTLTPQGARAMASTSVLDRERVAAVLGSLGRHDRKRALQGLELLAKACLQWMAGREDRKE